ncbi:MAG: hypothetical protein O2816_07080 [Planctomycetota bacterium]|nr:hypothetical protein [Planctomycetota bacterium]
MRILPILLVGLLMADLSDAQRRGNRRDRIITGTNGEVLDRKGDFFSAVGGNPSSAMAGGYVSSTALPKGVYEITLPNTGTGWEEKFLVGVPTAPLNPAPCLVIHHGYGEEHIDMVTKTSYFQEAMARGWIVVAPLGAHKFNYAIDYAQVNVELAITWVANYLTLDPDRFYSVGFSMGGGMATAFSARHLSAHGPRFAALAVHTGTCSMRDVYWSSNDKSLLENPLMFGGTPDEEPFRYATASSIDLDTFTDQVDQETDLVRNLANVPTYHFAALFDPNGFLTNQTEKNHAQLLLRGGDSTHVTSNDTVHQWYTLDETQVLDWLETKVYTAPDPGVGTRLLADSDGRWMDIRVDQAAAGEFTPLRFTAITALNRLYVDEVENAEELGLNPDKLGLDSSVQFELVFANTDGLAVDLVLEGYSQAPTDVVRSGQSTTDWTHDPVKRTLTLHEYSAANYPIWKIIP